MKSAGGINRRGIGFYFITLLQKVLSGETNLIRGLVWDCRAPQAFCVLPAAGDPPQLYSSSLLTEPEVRRREEKVLKTWSVYTYAHTPAASFAVNQRLKNTYFNHTDLEPTSMLAIFESIFGLSNDGLKLWNVFLNPVSWNDCDDNFKH